MAFHTQSNSSRTKRVATDMLSILSYTDNELYEQSVEHIAKKQKNTVEVIEKLPESVKLKTLEATTLAYNAFPPMRENFNSIFNEEFVTQLNHNALEHYATFCFDTVNVLTKEQKSRRKSKQLTPAQHELSIEMINIRSSITTALNSLRLYNPVLPIQKSAAKLTLKQAGQELQLLEIRTRSLVKKCMNLEENEANTELQLSLHNHAPRAQTKNFALHVFIPNHIQLQHRYYVIDDCTIDLQTDNPLIVIFEEMVAFFSYSSRVTLTDKLHFFLGHIKRLELTKQQRESIHELMPKHAYEIHPIMIRLNTLEILFPENKLATALPVLQKMRDYVMQNIPLQNIQVNMPTNKMCFDSYLVNSLNFFESSLPWAMRYEISLLIDNIRQIFYFFLEKGALSTSVDIPKRVPEHPLVDHITRIKAYVSTLGKNKKFKFVFTTKQMYKRFQEALDIMTYIRHHVDTKVPEFEITQRLSDPQLKVIVHNEIITRVNKIQILLGPEMGKILYDKIQRLRMYLLEFVPAKHVSKDMLVIAHDTTNPILTTLNEIEKLMQNALQTWPSRQAQHINNIQSQVTGLLDSVREHIRYWKRTERNIDGFLKQDPHPCDYKLDEITLLTPYKHIGSMHIWIKTLRELLSYSSQEEVKQMKIQCALTSFQNQFYANIQELFSLIPHEYQVYVKKLIDEISDYVTLTTDKPKQTETHVVKRGTHPIIDKIETFTHLLPKSIKDMVVQLLNILKEFTLKYMSIEYLPSECIIGKHPNLLAIFIKMNLLLHYLPTRDSCAIKQLIIDILIPAQSTMFLGDTTQHQVKLVLFNVTQMQVLEMNDTLQEKFRRKCTVTTEKSHVTPLWSTVLKQDYLLWLQGNKTSALLLALYRRLKLQEFEVYMQAVQKRELCQQLEFTAETTQPVRHVRCKREILQPKTRTHSFNAVENLILDMETLKLQLQICDDDTQIQLLQPPMMAMRKHVSLLQDLELIHTSNFKIQQLHLIQLAHQLRVDELFNTNDQNLNKLAQESDILFAKLIANNIYRAQ